VINDSAGRQPERKMIMGTMRERKMKKVWEEHTREIMCDPEQYARLINNQMFPKIQILKSISVITDIDELEDYDDDDIV